MFAYERTMLALRKENAELTARCEELRSELDKISTAPLRLDVPSALPTVPFPETAAQTPPAANRQSKTKLEHLGDEVLAERKARYVAPEPNIKTGWLSRYARMVTSANLGAVLK